MERRELLKGGALLGAALATDSRAGGWGTAAAAHDEDGPPPPIFFFEGRLGGTDFPDWPFSFSVAGSRAQGFAFDAATAGGQLDGLRFEGRVREGGRLSMRVYALDDLNHRRPLGKLVGAANRRMAQGTLELPQRAGASGTFQAQVVPVSEAETRRLIGIYQGVARDQAGNSLYTATLVLRPDHRWELRRVEVAPGLPELVGGAGQRLKGRYSVARDGRLLLKMTRVPLRFRQSRPAAPRGEQREPRPGGAPRRRAGVGPRGAGGPVVFSDSTFANGDWTAVKIEDTTPGQAATFQAEQVAAGGNPGAFRRTTLSWFGNGEELAIIQVGHIREAFVYDPATSGAIASISFAWDLIELDPSGEGATCRYFLLLRQGDTYYLSSGAFDNVRPEGWLSIAHAGLTANNFTRVTGPGPLNPDFSASGAPIRFGYDSLGTTFSGERLCVSGLDNYQVAVTPQEVFRTLTLVGTDEPGAGIEVEYVATVRDAGGQPAPDEPVVFHLEVEGLPALDVPALTDASGQARFRHTFPIQTVNERFTLTACLDENRNGSCDPLEPADEIDGFVESVRVSIEGPTQADLGAQVCYTATVEVGGIEEAGHQVLLVAQGAGEPLAQGITNDSGEVQLCFNTPNKLANLTLTACADLNGSGACDESEPRSREIALVVSPPAEEPIECDECCLINLIVALQTPPAQPSALGTAGEPIVIEHPFTHLVAVFTRVR